jgi:hypothetical protein
MTAHLQRKLESRPLYAIPVEVATLSPVEYS